MMEENSKIVEQQIYTKTILNTNMKQSSTIDVWATMKSSNHDQDVHTIPLNMLFPRFHTNARTGLSTAFVHEARLQYGNNTITTFQSPGYFWALAKQLFIGFNLILWIGAVFAFIGCGKFSTSPSASTTLYVGVVLLLVIILNAILNAYQEMKSIKIVASFSSLLPTIATVRRDSVEQQIVTDELVPGDIILIKAGDKIPADCRFFVCNGLKINASELTGESKPVAATVENSSETFMESTNIGFYSTLVEQGTGEAMVIATGNNTVFGKMSNMTRGNSSQEIPGLRREVNRFVLFIVLVTIFGIISLWFTWGLWLNYVHPTFIDVIDNCLSSIGMIVGFLPIGLPPSITLVLTIVAKRMYQQRILGKSLEIVETFDAVSVIATDKTGTLTQNKMKVTKILWDMNDEYNVTAEEEKELLTKSIHRKGKQAFNIGHHGKVKPISMPPSSNLEKHSDISEKSHKMKSEVIHDLLLGAALCNDAEKRLVQDDDDDDDEQNKEKTHSELRLIGNAADIALYKLCVYEFDMEINEIRHLNPRLKVLPFNSVNKFMISANRVESYGFSSENNERTILMTLKGAPDIVIQRCASYKTDDNQILPLTIEIKQKLLNRQETLGKTGYRVIGICQQKFSEKQYIQRMQNYEKNKHIRAMLEEDLDGFPENNYCFLGFFCLIDPPRADAADAILKLHRAHIRVAMITGDHFTTATAIAKQVNIFSSTISETNGTDTIQIGTNHKHQRVLRLYRNQILLREHIPGKVTSFTTENQAIRAIVKPSSPDVNKGDLAKGPSLYKRFLFWCGNQFREPKSNLIKEETKIEKIPYAIIVTGSEIDFLDDSMWSWVLAHQELIFARTSPEQKLRIVMEFQRRGETVAVIGDGTNDVPSLKCANIGIAMQSGTQVSKEVSDIILLNNSFASIVQITEMGRLLSDNLKKVFVYLLPGGSWSEFWPVFFNYWFGIPLALSAFMAIIFCVLNDLFMSLAMVTENAESDIMSRPPSVRNKTHIFNLRALLQGYLFVGCLECFTAFFCFCYYWVDNGVPFYSLIFTFENFGSIPPLNYSSAQLNVMVQTSQSVYYSSLCIFQFFNFFVTRTRYTSVLQQNPLWGKTRNLYPIGAMIISIVVQVIFTQISWFNHVFGTAPIAIKYVMPTFGFGMLLLLIDELRKLYIRKYPSSILAKMAW